MFFRTRDHMIQSFFTQPAIANYASTTFPETIKTDKNLKKSQIYETFETAAKMYKQANAHYAVKSENEKKRAVFFAKIKFSAETRDVFINVRNQKKRKNKIHRNFIS